MREECMTKCRPMEIFVMVLEMFEDWDHSKAHDDFNAETGDASRPISVEDSFYFRVSGR